MSFKDDREDTGEARTDTGQPAAARRHAGEAGLPEAPDAHMPRQAARHERFSTRLFAHRWSIVAGTCLLVAAACLLMGRMDATFVAGTLGIVAWFWNERNRLRPHGIEAEERLRDEDEEFEDQDEK